jgi:hypothetical protein
MVQIFFVAHLFACFWNYITLDGVAVSHTTWVDFPYENDDYTSTTTTTGDNGTNSGDNFIPKPLYGRYIAAIYWVITTMLTVGYGDIKPTNDVERLYSIVTMLTGGVVFGAMISRYVVRNPLKPMKRMKPHLFYLKHIKTPH